MQNFIGHDLKVSIEVLMFGILQSPNASYKLSLTWLWQIQHRTKQLNYVLYLNLFVDIQQLCQSDPKLTSKIIVNLYMKIQHVDLKHLPYLHTPQTFLALYFSSDSNPSGGGEL